MVRGWVYIITNVSMPELVKIGYSTKDPIQRARELNNTGVPHPYIVAYDVLVINPRKCEAFIHKKCRSKREGKEWFKLTVYEAINAIRETVDKRIIVEKIHSDLNGFSSKKSSRCQSERDEKTKGNEGFMHSPERPETLGQCDFHACTEKAVKFYDGGEYCVWHFREILYPDKTESIRAMRMELDK